MPTIPLPKTLAAIRTDREAASENSSHELAAVLVSELPASAVPMENYLERGGWPELVGIEVRGLRDRGKTMELLLTLRFVEHTPAACPSSSKPEIRIAYIKAAIDKATGAAEILDDS